ncbi:polymorphic toxin type 17 domain-containing protein [Nonomuraea sp. NPDC050310]|uniref:polymorphic toxin type 17 domain-containing protein n=1 Tax=Nonomuraea sp. NPDC050310 TaxID=3154935 RepID=UPI0033E7D853
MPPDRDSTDFAGIDPVQLKGMIGDLDDVKSLINEKTLGLDRDFGRAGLDTKHVTTLRSVADWIHGELPMLRRRQSMTEQISKEHGVHGFTGSMVESEWAGHFKSPEEAQAKAKELAGKYEHPAEFPADAWEQIRKYQFDPDFAEAFAKELGPEKLALLAARAKNPRAWGDEEKDAEGRFPAIATILAVASHRGVVDDKFVEKMGLPLMADLMMHGTWNTQTLVRIGNQGVKIMQLGGGNVITARILDAVARNPLAAHEVYKTNFELINNMAYGKHIGWMNTKNPDLGDPLGRFLKAATVDAADAFERMNPGAKNPADELVLKLFQVVAEHKDERFPFAGVEDAFIEIVQRFFKGTYTEDLLPEGGLTWYQSVQLVADLVGIFDPTPISDGVSGLLSLGQGDWKGAMLSMAAVVPYFGDAAAKPIKTFMTLVKAFPALKIFFKVPDDAVTDVNKLKAYAKAITEGFDSLKNTLKNVDLKNPGKVMDALGVVNRLHTDAAKIYAKYPKWAERAKKLGLPTDGPVPFVPPKNWDPNRANAGSGITDAFGNVWQRGKQHGRGQNNVGKEWDVQVKKDGGLAKLTADGKHLNVEWETGRVGN